jgi:DNA repair protein RadC
MSPPKPKGRACPFQTADQPGHYLATRPVSADDILAMARRLIAKRFAGRPALANPQDAVAFLIPKLSLLEHETFCGLFLDLGDFCLKIYLCMR